eukprot:CAMPEP_0119277950 /NCGR_PEP_ID=MMETSP1329-20130426/18195_1 /TAXON_ID=114041 /ORGANISM="Genus nov. species nov., Strain RCC1024" /LENGTH=390 /DNA_ID=CAMNT_0007278445 /DNA_START=144 /DNA_END=1313 /DNA_ORIENTATION=+
MCKKAAFAAVDQPSPYDSCGWLSRLTYLYALPLFRLGAARPLAVDDLPPIAARDSLPTIAARISASWDDEQTRQKPSLARALLRCFRREYVVSGILFLFDFAAIVTQAALLRPFINWLESGRGGASAGALWGVLIALMGLVNLVSHHFSFYMLMRGGWNARLGLTVLLHAKLLRTRASEVARVSTGYVVSLITNDCQRFDNLLPFLHCPWASSVLLVYAYLLIARIVGYRAAAAGCGVLLASVVIQIRLGFKYKSLRARTAAHTDARVRLISELLRGILSVKAFGWEDPFLESVARARAKEAGTILRAQWCRSVTAGLYFCTTALATFATYATFFYTRRGARLRVGDVTAVVALLNALRQIISFGNAYFMMAAPEAVVATKRMQRFLELE